MKNALEVMNEIMIEYFGGKEHSYLVEYSKTYLPVYVAEFIDFEISKEFDRKLDQWRGCPYTSNKWPWPVSKISGNYLSPGIQLDLGKASTLVDLKLGDGVLQVWFDDGDWEMRIIPNADLNEAEDYFIPKFLESNYLFEFDSSYFIKWIPFGFMYPRVLKTFPELLDLATDKEWGAQEALDELLAERLPINIGASDGFSGAQLGGYWYCAGNEGGGAEWPENPNLPKFGMKSRVIFSMTDSMGTSLLIVAEFNDDSSECRIVASIVHS